MKGWICALVIVLACANPTSSRAYFKYVPPQEPPAKRYKVVKTLKAVVSRYIKPERKYYHSKAAFDDAIALNGKGKETAFGTKPEANVTIAAYVNRSEKHHKKGAFQRGTIVRILEGDKILVTGKIDDRCAEAEKLWKRKRIVQLDVFSKMSQAQADAWGKRELSVEVLQPI